MENVSYYQTVERSVRLCSEVKTENKKTTNNEKTKEQTADIEWTMIKPVLNYSSWYMGKL